MTFLERIRTQRLYIDGAMGTMLQASGLPAGECPEAWNLTNPQKVAALHRAYVQAGAQIACTNTFGAYDHKLQGISVEDTARAAVRIAREACPEYVALDVGPTGKLVEPMGQMSVEEAVECFARLIRAGEGADCILIETIEMSVLS